MERLRMRDKESGEMEREEEVEERGLEKTLTLPSKELERRESGDE